MQILSEEQTGRIYNQRSYILTLLYRAKEQQQIDIANQVKYDMAHTDWIAFYKKREELQIKQAEQEQKQQEQKQKQNISDGSGSDLYELLQRVKGHKRE